MSVWYLIVFHFIIYLLYACMQYQNEVKSVLKMLLSRPRPLLNYLKSDIILFITCKYWSSDTENSNL